MQSSLILGQCFHNYALLKLFNPLFPRALINDKWEKQTLALACCWSCKSERILLSSQKVFCCGQTDLAKSCHSACGKQQVFRLEKNLDEIIKMFEGIMGDTAGNMTVRPNGEMGESRSFVAVPVWFTAKKGSISFDLGGMDLFEVKSGKIMHVWTFSDDQQVDDEFWRR